jgi:hypothetical protein
VLKQDRAQAMSPTEALDGTVQRSMLRSFSMSLIMIHTGASDMILCDILRSFFCFGCLRNPTNNYTGLYRKQGKVALFGWVLMLVFLGIVVANSFISGSINALLSYISFGMGVVMLAMITYAHINCDYLEGVDDHPSGWMTTQEGMVQL